MLTQAYKEREVQPALPSLKRSPIAPLSILLVEDNLADAFYIQNLLDGIDIPYTIERLEKGNQVFPYLRQHSADVILLDLGLPDLDGFEVLAELMNQRGSIRNIPIVVLTGYEHFMYLKNTYMPHILDYITKPCSVDKLRAALLPISNASYPKTA